MRRYDTGTTNDGGTPVGNEGLAPNVLSPTGTTHDGCSTPSR